MLHLYDSASGELTDIVPARRGQLSLLLPVPTRRAPSLDDLRLGLTADLIRRIGLVLRMSVTLCVYPDVLGAGGAPNGLGADGAALNIYPPDYTLDSRSVAQAVARIAGEEADLKVKSTGTEDAGDVGTDATATSTEAAPGGTGQVWPRAVRHIVGVRPVTVTGSSVVPGTAPGLAAVTADGLDPLAVRLALLRRHYRTPAALSMADLDAAGHELHKWRMLVAKWATRPSRPVSTSHVDRVTSLLDRDLDAPGAMAVLKEMAFDEQVPPGARFETAAHLDRLLGLDLTSDVGRL